MYIYINGASNPLNKTNSMWHSGSSVNTLMMGKNVQVSETCSHFQQEFALLPWSLWTDWKTAMAAAAWLPVSGGRFAGHECPRIRLWRKRVSVRDSADPRHLSELCSSSCCHRPEAQRGKVPRVSGRSWTRSSSGSEFPAPLCHAWTRSSPVCPRDSRKPRRIPPRSKRVPVRGRPQRENGTARCRRREWRPGV